MKKITTTLLILLTFATFFSCKKTENRTNNSVTYVIDSIRLQSVSLTTNDTSNIFTIPLRNSFRDSFIALSISYNNLQILHDTTIIQYYEYPSGTPELREQNILKGDGLLSNYWTYRPATHEQYTYNSIYKYDASNKLDSVNSVYDVFFLFGYTKQIIVDRKLQYSSNNLSQINEDIKIHYLDALDSVENKNSVSTFTYQNNYSNQKDMIGIDINDFILNEYNSQNLVCHYNSILNIGSYVGIVCPYLICFKSLSYKTNSNSLIESITFNHKTFFDNIYIDPATTTLTASYTFDATKNNRVTTMKINNPITQTQQIYTFYYKD